MSKINRFFNQKSTEFSNENQSKFCQFEHILSSIFMSTNMSLRHIIYLDPPVHMSKYIYIYIYYYIIFDMYTCITYMITSCMCMYAGRGLSSPCNIHFINMGYPALPWPMIGLSSPVELMGLASPHFSLALQPQCYLQQAANGYSSHNWPHPFSHFGQHHESSARSSRPTISKW